MEFAVNLKSAGKLHVISRKWVFCEFSYKIQKKNIHVISEFLEVCWKEKLRNFWGKKIMDPILKIFLKN